MEVQVVVFRLNDEEYAVPIAQTKEIILHRGTTRLPNTPGFMEGIINVRGQIIPVINMAAKFGLADNGNADRKVMIVELEAGEVGITVDEVTEVLRLADDAIEPRPGMAEENECIMGIGKTGDRLIILLDLPKLFAGNEILSLPKVS